MCYVRCRLPKEPCEEIHTAPVVGIISVRWHSVKNNTVVTDTFKTESVVGKNEQIYRQLAMQADRLTNK